MMQTSKSTTSRWMEKLLAQKALPLEIANEADIKYIDLEASKVWDDQDNQEGLRPASEGIPTL